MAVVCENARREGRVCWGRAERADSWGVRDLAARRAVLGRARAGIVCCCFCEGWVREGRRPEGQWEVRCGGGALEVEVRSSMSVRWELAGMDEEAC